MSFTFKINEQSVKNVEQSVKDAFKKVIANQKMLGEIGETIVVDVVEQTRSNEKSIPNKMKDLPLLRESWIKRRDALSRSNSTNEEYQSGRSNLTFTGQLLNSLSWAVTGIGKIKIYFYGFHKPYLSLRKKEPIGEEITNEQLAAYVSKTRPFVGVRPAIRLRVSRLVRSYMKRALLVAKLTKGVDSP